jgi:hypothetical protein
MLASRLFLLCASFTLVFVLAAGPMSAPALADEIVHIYFGGDSGDDEDDDDVVVYVTANGDLYAVIYDRYSGQAQGWVDLPDGNPDPDGGSTGLAPDVQSLLDALKKAGGTMRASSDFYSTFLGRMLTEMGMTIVPVHNPADVGYEIDGYGGGSGGFDPSSGDIREHVQNLKKKGNGNGGDDDDDDGDGGKTPTTEDLYGYGMSGPPELINPVPISRMATVSPRQSVATVGGQAPAGASDTTLAGTLR